MIHKRQVLRLCKTAYCIKLDAENGYGSGYIVWPEHGTRPRGFEQSAIGIGRTARSAWTNALDALKTPNKDSAT
jgi:hypothetical protein